MLEGFTLAGLVGIGKSLLDQAKGTKKNTEDIKALRTELDQTSANVLKLTAEIQHLKETQELREKNLLLQLKNELLEHQRQLPPPKD